MMEQRTKEELTTIRQEVAYRKRIAEERGLDRLFLDVYHRCVRYYPVWIHDAKLKNYIYPGVSAVSEKIVKDPFGDTYITEFSIGPRHYVISSKRLGTMIAHDLHYVVELFMNGEKAFAVSEQHDIRLTDRHYFTLDVDAYVHEAWADDFKKIRSFHEHLEREAQAEKADDPQLINNLKKDFNLGTGSIIRLRPWPGYRIFRLILLLIILILATIAFFEFLRLSQSVQPNVRGAEEKFAGIFMSRS
ncbi:MAG: hypothetical protein A2945_00515 [Candidatus Liptonbacteria bacterium RIFCSPLOWO2_01_FULL_52_25]|uniref:Uncharacterized protein n=1 Tax=Candidatus Liptonbacteria bacterium RIFCSPLOWO2_01_FULL_52_25 TaxID=1798650 RepID=A0A1G2CFG5_9BACT|nr:MAG: hypothetical protein A2945_00515 [Candidatus Liptonbacteria bacterium RIFCSPLOWO2_01_FULL_52_25]